MCSSIHWLWLLCIVLLPPRGSCRQFIMTTDELENHISPEDMEEFYRFFTSSSTAGPGSGGSTVGPGLDTRLGEVPLDQHAAANEETAAPAVPHLVDCFGLGALTRQLPWLFNMRPDPAELVNTHFYFSSRDQPKRVQVLPGPQFGLEWADFRPSRKSVLITHGFMSHSNASWVHDMTRAFLDWGDVNVITVDWSGGGNTWKYWRAVANTRRVGAELTRFIRQLMNATGAGVKDFHFVGHSLGAHINSYASYHLGRVHRITGLDPAQPCFSTSNLVEKLDPTDADFVDVIHTNGRLLQRIGFGLPDPIGDADFYPNGGMKQPGCYNSTKSFWARLFPITPTKLQQAVCSHGRAYLLFTESLVNNNCSFRGHRWNLTYEGVNASLASTCERGSCAQMGIGAAGGGGAPRASGPYFVITAEKQPYCPAELRHPQRELLMDLQHGFRLDTASVLSARSDPAPPAGPAPAPSPATCKKKSWFQRWFG